MFNHVYPAWHKPVQRVLFIIAALLCITLPVAYGKRHYISSTALGTVLGLYFGLWLLFSLMVRFLVPSPTIESTLPTYTHSPIPVPVALHSPTRSDAKPAAPAIRLHPSSTHSGELTSSLSKFSGRRPHRPTARFAGENNNTCDDDYYNKNDDDDDVDVDKKDIYSSGITSNNNNKDNNNDSKETDQSNRTLSPTQHQKQISHTNSVKFQTRPRGNTGDSANSASYPTFAAYRQSQRGNLDEFAQRIKKAFVSQQQQQQQRQLEELERRKMEQGEQEFADGVRHSIGITVTNNNIEARPGLREGGGGVREPIHLQALSPSDIVSQAEALDRQEEPEDQTRSRSIRSRSSSFTAAAAAANLLGDFAERIKSSTGSLFNRSSSSLLPRSVTDPPQHDQQQQQQGHQGNDTDTGSETRPGLSQTKSHRSSSRLGMDDGSGAATQISDTEDVQATRQEKEEYNTTP